MDGPRSWWRHNDCAWAHGQSRPPSPGVRLDRDRIGVRHLRALLRRAREGGGLVKFRGHEYTVAQLTAALKGS